jgi:hypothetical protein
MGASVAWRDDASCARMFPLDGGMKVSEVSTIGRALLVMSGSLSASISSPLIMYKDILHLKCQHLIMSHFPICSDASILLHSRWSNAGVSCTQSLDHL